MLLGVELIAGKLRVLAQCEQVEGEQFFDGWHFFWRLTSV